MASFAATEKPVYVLYGALRSGTTLLRLILDAHPRLHCPGERDFMLDHLYPGPGGLRLDRAGLELDRVFRSSRLAMPTGEGAETFADFLRQQEKDDSTLVLVIHREFERLLDLVPDLRIIHLLRDPRDVARSSIGLGWAGSTWYGVDHWIGTETQWNRVSSRLTPEQVLNVHYEELLARPKQILEQICVFLGQSYDPAMMSYSETSTYSAIDPGLRYQWKNKQSELEVALVEHKLGSLLVARGYAPSGYPPQAPTPMKRLSLWISNKIAIWRHLFARHGYVDPVLVRLTGKLGLSRFVRGAQLRMHERQNRSLK